MDSKIASEIKALISLVDEPDERIFSEIAEKIKSFGADAIPWLEDKWENSFEQHVQQRILNIIHNIQFSNTCTRFELWVKTGNGNLFAAYMLVSRYQYPDLKEEEIIKKIDAIKRDVWMELNDDLTGLEKVKVINHIIYDVHGFTGNTTDFHSPQNSYINTLLETRRGNPLSLGMLYIIIARQLNLPVYGVNIPEHFVLAYTNELPEDRMQFLDEKAVLFYINPFSKGAVFSKKELEQFFEQRKIKPDEVFCKPCSNTDIIRRMINNLINSYSLAGETKKVKELEILQGFLK